MDEEYVEPICVGLISGTRKPITDAMSHKKFIGDHEGLCASAWREKSSSPFHRMPVAVFSSLGDAVEFKEAFDRGYGRGVFLGRASHLLAGLTKG
jgi:hypothetical protein